MAIALTTVLLTLGLMAITGGFAIFLGKIGPIALWGLLSSLMLMSITFGFPTETILGLATLCFLLEVIVVVIDG